MLDLRSLFILLCFSLHPSMFLSSSFYVSLFILLCFSLSLSQHIFSSRLVSFLYCTRVCVRVKKKYIYNLCACVCLCIVSVVKVSGGKRKMRISITLRIVCLHTKNTHTSVFLCIDMFRIQAHIMKGNELTKTSRLYLMIHDTAPSSFLPKLVSCLHRLQNPDVFPSVGVIFAWKIQPTVDFITLFRLSPWDNIFSCVSLPNLWFE